MKILCILGCLLLGAAAAPSVNPSDVTFYLYTRNNVEAHHQIEEVTSLPHFDPQKSTVFITHGWEDSYKADINVLLRTAILKKYDANVIVVDWNPVASLDYITVAGLIIDVGDIVGSFVDNFMDTYGLDGSKLVLIGHSFGAHVTGVAGSRLKRQAALIVGSDPAGLLFSEERIDNRLDPTDAQYVQVIHTNGRLIGFSSPIGTVDYYPNGGMVQAGCGLDLLGSCSHDRAYRYLAEAIDGGHFTATLCDNYDNFEKNRCSENRKTEMGSLEIDTSITGNYYLKTQSAAPYALG